MTNEISASFKVLHVAETLRGGIATHLCNLLPGQLERYGSNNVKLIGPGSHLPDMDRLVPYCIGYKKSASRVLNAFRVAFVLRKVSKAMNPDIIHIHSTFAGAICRPVVWFFRNRPAIIYCPHGWSFMRHSRLDQAAAKIEKFLSYMCDAIICVSSHSASIALKNGIPPKKLQVIRNGLFNEYPETTSTSTTQIVGPEHVKRLIFIGRFDNQKGLDLLLSALSELKGIAHLHVFGAGVLNQANPISIPDNVTLHGWLPFEEIKSHLKGCHALVAASRWEGLPYVALEAMRAGKAVIATRVGGFPEVVEDGVTGILVDPEDVAGLINAIKTITVKELEVMGTHGHERFTNHFGAEKMEMSMAELYKKVVCRTV